MTAHYIAFDDLPTNEHVAATDDLWGVNDFDVKRFLAACDVKEGTPADWLRATVGAHMDIPHVSGAKVVQLAAMPPEEWALQ